MEVKGEGAVGDIVVHDISECCGGLDTDIVEIDGIAHDIGECGGCLGGIDMYSDGAVVDVVACYLCALGGGDIYSGGGCGDIKRVYSTLVSMDCNGGGGAVEDSGGWIVASEGEWFVEREGFVVGTGVDVDSVVVCCVIDSVGYGGVIARSGTTDVVGGAIL